MKSINVLASLLALAIGFGAGRGGERDNYLAWRDGDKPVPRKEFRELKEDVRNVWEQLEGGYPQTVRAILERKIEKLERKIEELEHCMVPNVKPRPLQGFFLLKGEDIAYKAEAERRSKTARANIEERIQGRLLEHIVKSRR